MSETVRLFLELSGEKLDSLDSSGSGWTVLCKSGQAWYVTQNGSDIVAERLKR